MGTRISSKTSLVVAIIAAVLALLGAPATGAPPGDITEYPVPTVFGGPDAITAGPDGNLWFTAIIGGIGRITPTGRITAVPLPTDQSDSLSGITAGPDGNLWYSQRSVVFTLDERGLIGRISPTGTVTEYPLPDAGSAPSGIAAGPDGNVWFTETTWRIEPGQVTVASSAIGRITPTGAITEYPLPKASSQPGAIAAGPDGNMWFTLGGKIGRITPTGAITEYPLPRASSQPGGIAAGPDGNVWFTETTWRKKPGQGLVPSGGAIGRITPRGRITEYPLGKASQPGGITTGADGNLWFTEGRGDKIGRSTTEGAITEYRLPSVDSWPSGITSGPDGNIWFTELRGEQIGRISPTDPPTAVKQPCPVNVTLHKPIPTKVGDRILTDKITTNTTSCHLFKPVVLCRPLATTVAGEKAFCDTKVTRRGQIRVNTLGRQAVRVTVIVRATPRSGRADSWKPYTWRKGWLLTEPTAATNTNETDLTLSKSLVQGMDQAGVGIKAIRGAKLSKSGVVTFPVTNVKGDVITHKGALVFSSSKGFVTLQDIALNYTTGKASALVQATAVPTGIQITDVLTFTGGQNQIKQSGTWIWAKVALGRMTSLGDPAPLFAGQLGLPPGSITSGMTIGRATITLKR